WSRDGEFTLSREPPERYDPPVAEPLASDSFLARDTSQPQAAVLWASATGLQQWRGAPVHPDLRSRFAMKGVLGARVQGQCATGHLFSLDQHSLTADDLVLGEIVAAHVAASLDHYLLSRRLEQAAAVEERVRLRELVRRLESVWGLQVELLLEHLGAGIADGLAYEICHIVQEALVNAARHAGASQVHVAVRGEDGRVRITVADNGHGFAFHG